MSTLDRFAMAPMLVAIAADLRAPLAAVVSAAGAYFLAYGLSQPVWGVVSDRFGRVRTMRLTLLLAGLLSMAAAVAGSVAVLAVTRGLAGGFFGAAYPSALIYLGDTVPAGTRQRALARLMVGVALGTALASAAAGSVADLSSWRLVFLATGAGAVVLSGVLRSLPEPVVGRPRTSPAAALRAIARSGPTLVVLGLAFVEGAVLVGVLTLVPTAAHAGGASLSLAGLATAVYGLAVLVGSAVVARLSLTWHPWRLIAAGGAAAVLACSLMAVTQEAWMAAAVAFLLGLAWTALHSSLQTWATEVLPGARALVVACFAGSLFAGSSVAAVSLADLVDAGRFTVIFAGAAVLATSLTVAAAVARSRWTRPACHRADPETSGRGRTG
ncbi:MFS transporter [Geodermatophilus ruber]|uniref:Predicted arabinose efflux permease, MFS family n=1 Tax=Geodermatophilus ruber TaxID=504800 RepID=A0A1I4C9Q6_9ACTN|nr:MFS transporter [Geodermatophilus ruber]SFK77904.1 Predicted arabinose efflux permease, MFS family [Geodermatophilus ruber]